MRWIIIIGICIFLVGCNTIEKEPCWRTITLGDTKVLVAGYYENITFTDTKINYTYNMIEACCTKYDSISVTCIDFDVT